MATLQILLRSKDDKRTRVFPSSSTWTWKKTLSLH